MCVWRGRRFEETRRRTAARSGKEQRHPCCAVHGASLAALPASRLATPPVCASDCAGSSPRPTIGYPASPEPAYRPAPVLCSGYAHGSYQQVCGAGHEVVGDAVVPLDSALLPGAQHVVLDGVFHSMSRVRTFNEPAEFPWYGSEEVVDTWLAELGSGGGSGGGGGSS